MTKAFKDTNAKVDKSKLQNYKIVKPGEVSFVQTTGNEKCLCIAVNHFLEPIVVTPVNEVFKVDESQLLADYLYIWWCRKESDRYARFNSWGSARETFDWNDMCRVKIPVPSLSVQRNVVETWQGLRKMKEENEKLVEPLLALCRSYLQDCKKKYPMKGLGEYIVERNERNKEYIFDAECLQGVACTQQFIKSIANTQGMDLGNHKIVRHGDFAYSNRINVGSIAFRDGDDCIVSPSYTVFYVKDKTKLLPQFLSILYTRQEFLRATLFFAFGTIKDDFGFSEMARYRIPLPPIEVQQAVVDVYRCANEAKRIAEEADRLSREICPALVRWAAEGG
ncbi:MAG: restriction endonuclease subunit S [Kiritimatiellae bacterium]|nr:restriction endonuclease subunit S [Kiritimatiellia bacterium]